MWVMAHTNQFASPGWKFLPVGNGSGFLPQNPGGSVRTVGCEACPVAKESAPRKLWLHYPEKAGGRVGQIQVASDGQCLTKVAVADPGMAGHLDVGHVVSVDCNRENSEAQMWRFEAGRLKLGNGSAADLCLTASSAGGALELSAQLTVEACAEASNSAWQRWAVDGHCNMSQAGNGCLIQLQQPNEQLLVAEPVCPVNRSGFTCGGTKHDPKGDGSATLCGAACCGDPSCKEWHWKRIGGSGAAGGCWRGACSAGPSPAAGWVGGTRGYAPPPPAPPARKPRCCVSQQHPYIAAPSRRQLDSPSPIDYGGSFVGFVSPDASEFAIVIETMDATAAATHRFKIGAAGVSDILNNVMVMPTHVHVWQTTEHLNFQQLADVPVSPSGLIVLLLQPMSVYTFTTTTGQRDAPRTSSPATPRQQAFPCKHAEDFDRLPLDSLAPFFADQTGTFAVAEESDDTLGLMSANSGRIYTQQVPEPTDNAGQNAPHPIAIIGDRGCENVTVVAAVRFASGCDGSDMLAIGGRVAGAPTNPSRLWSAGVFLWIAANGTFAITGAGGGGGGGTGAYKRDAARADWVELRLKFSGSTAHASIDGETVASMPVEVGTSNGYVAIGCSYGSHSFDNVSICCSDDERCSTPQLP